MLGADSMPRSDNAALEEGERRFDGVRVNVSVNVDLRFVLYPSCADPSRRQCFLNRGRVGVQFIRYDDVHVLAHVLADVLRQCAGFHILSMEESQIATALPDADYDLFFGSVPSNARPFFSLANVGFVHLDSAIQHRGSSASFMAARMRWQRYHAVL